MILNDRATQSFNEGVLTAKTTIANPQFDFSWECVVDYLGESMKVRRALIWIGEFVSGRSFSKLCLGLPHAQCPFLYLFLDLCLV